MSHRGSARRPRGPGSGSRRRRETRSTRADADPCAGPAFSLRRFLREAGILWRGIAPRPRDLPALGPMLFYRMTLAALILAAARRVSSGVLLIDEQGPVTGEEMHDAVWVLAARIRTALAPSPAHRRVPAADRPLIGLESEGHRGFVAAVAAAGVLGVDLLFLPPGTGALDRPEILTRERVAVVLTDDDVLAAFAPERADTPGPTRPATWRKPRPARPGRLRLLTSGTTGTPSATTRTGVSASQLPTVISLLAALDLRRGEPVLLAPPLAHGHGLSVLTAALLAGAPPVLAHRRRASEMLDLARTHHVTALLAVPTQLARLVEHLRQHPDVRIPRLRRIAAGSGPLAPDVAEAILDRCGPVLVDFYGSSEAGTATIATAADLCAEPGTVGRAANGVRIWIEDTAGRPCRPGNRGRVRISSPWRAGNTDDEVATGDIGHLDRSGRLFLHGRGDDVAVVGGHNVHLATVRDWFARQPGVEEAHVRTHPDPDLGMVLAATLVGSDLSADDLRERARRELGSAAAPRQISVAAATGRHPR